MYDASGLLHKHTYNDRFVDELTITSEQDQMLRDARKKVRTAIRAAFTEARKYLKEEVPEADVEVISKIKPMFLTQGSYAYKTLNTPCQPCQEIDLDDGVYLPMSFINKEPSKNMEWFFWIVDGALKALAKQEGWEFTKEKSTCSRVTLPGNAHIDVPLYAIPDERHVKMMESVDLRNALNRKHMSAILFSNNMAVAKQALLDEEDVHLADRESGWRKSDPMAIAIWFKQEIAIRGYGSGQRLRRICRFLKGWRDFVWEKGGPSSLTLMVCAVEAYPEDDQDRDDYALLKVVEKLPAKLSASIHNLAFPYDSIYPRQNMVIEEIVAKANQLHNSLSSALSGSLDKNGVVRSFSDNFGNRIPANPDYIEEILAPSVVVRRTPARDIKPDPIPNTKAG
ncbi:MAG: hypothetical protein JAY90_13710 [Candidatus Thiodiazotropha lotti]|nr:hypothetical protein [Candidatus Thiodiazotropha lotti]